MEIPKAFVELLNLNDWTLGEWLPRESKEGHPCRFVRVNDTRGRLVFIARPYRFKKPINLDHLKMTAIKEIHQRFGKYPKISQAELLDYINSFEEIYTQLLEEAQKEHNVRMTLQRVTRTLSGRNFDPETLEFDLDKSLPSDLATVELQKQLADYRENPRQEEEYCYRSIGELELSVRAYNLIKGQGIRTVGELRHVKAIFYKTKGVGRITRDELEDHNLLKT